MDARLPQCAGFVLAGGMSTRMGRNKALLELDGETLIARGLRGLGAICEEVAIAGGGPELSMYGRIIPDARPGCGPLGGIVAALEQSAYEWNLFVPVDVPFVPQLVWSTLLIHAEQSHAPAVLAEAQGQVQPLCAVYARASARSMRDSLDAGLWKVRAAAEAAGPVERIRFAELDWFRNVNTPEEFAAVVHPTP